ncbi:MAG TPA: hypothetical protein VGJ32_13310 [Solirubrobacteraceae bacterium]
MRAVLARRLDLACGFSGLVFLAGFLVQGKPPSPDEPVATIAGYLADHRSAILAGDLLIAVAAVPFLWFLGAFRGVLGEAGETRLSAAAFLGAGVGVGIVLAGVAVQAALVLNSVHGSDALVRFAFDSFNALITIAGAALAVGVGAAAVSGARSGALPAWLFRTGAATALLQVATLPGLVAEGGPFAAGGAVALLAFVALVAWFTALTAHLLARRSG